MVMVLAKVVTRNVGAGRRLVNIVLARPVVRVHHINVVADPG